MYKSESKNDVRQALDRLYRQILTSQTICFDLSLWMTRHILLRKMEADFQDNTTMTKKLNKHQKNLDFLLYLITSYKTKV